ncbi:MAG: hypothetical protein IJV17_06065 [Prevotella sp.]|nr:hypothetical protein [Prevotella sp.]
MLSNIEITYYQHFKDTCPIQTTMEHIVRLIRDDAAVAAKTAAHRHEPQAGHKDACPLFAVAAVMRDGKSENKIERMTGLSLVDIDHADDLEALFRRACDDPHTMLCYRTISGRGLRIIFRYALDGHYPLRLQKQYYAKAFAYGNAYYDRLLGVTHDDQCKNVGRLSGIAHDADVYYHAGAQPFTKEEIQEASDRLLQRQKEHRKRQREQRRIAACYETMIRPEVEADGAVYAAGSHNDYVMRVGYKLNQFGFCLEAAKAWAVNQFADYEKTASVITSCYERTEEHGSRGGQKYCHEQDTDNRGLASVEEIQAFLTERIRLRHNVITGRVEYEADGRWLPITDRVVNTLWVSMAKDKTVKAQDIYRVIESDFVPAFHPFREYLEKLNEVPDEIDYFQQLADTITLKNASPALFYEYLRKWLVGMVAGWLDDTVVNNVILVLIGEQGLYKTTWFSYLLPPPLRHYFYTKTNANRMGRDDLLTLAQYGLVCCEELDTMRPSELNQLKAAVTMTSIDERAAYAHFHEHRPHIASFCGTGNNAQFLSDPTGNRRWLPFEVTAIRSPREHPFPYEGIYAQAYRLYKSGFRYWFSQDEIARLSKHNRQFETPKLEHELIPLYFRKPRDLEGGVFMSVGRAMQIINGSVSQRLSPIEMGRAFGDLGFHRVKWGGQRGYIVVQRTADEIQQTQRMMAAQAVSEDTLTGRQGSDGAYGSVIF